MAARPNTRWGVMAALVALLLGRSMAGAAPAAEVTPETKSLFRAFASVVGAIAPAVVRVEGLASDGTPVSASGLIMDTDGNVVTLAPLTPAASVSPGASASIT